MLFDMAVLLGTLGNQILPVIQIMLMRTPQPEHSPGYFLMELGDWKLNGQFQSHSSITLGFSCCPVIVGVQWTGFSHFGA